MKQKNLLLNIIGCIFTRWSITMTNYKVRARLVAFNDLPDG